MIGPAGELFRHTIDDVVRHERLAIVFADVTVDVQPGLAPHVAEELSSMVILDDNRVP